MTVPKGPAASETRRYAANQLVIAAGVVNSAVRRLDGFSDSTIKNDPELRHLNQTLRAALAVLCTPRPARKETADVS